MASENKTTQPDTLDAFAVKAPPVDASATKQEAVQKKETAKTSGATAASKTALWAARVALTVVFAVNVQCAAQFIIWPDAFAPAYELAGVAGSVAVQGLGVAFLMWNVTYPPAIIDPV